MHDTFTEEHHVTETDAIDPTSLPRDQRFVFWTERI